MFDQKKKDIVSEKIQNIGKSPLDILLVGPTGVGKSSTINALINANYAKVGYTPNPETMEVACYTWENCMRFWDSPGLGDGKLDQAHKEKIRRLLRESYSYNGRRYGKIDFVLVIIDISSRDIGTSTALLNDVIIPEMSENRVMIAFNRCDFAMSGRHWEKSAPDEILLKEINKRDTILSERINRDCNLKIPKKPICYSAQYYYNTDILFEKLVNTIPNYKRKFMRATK